jgi:hypothetical protein
MIKKRIKKEEPKPLFLINIKERKREPMAPFNT